MLISLVLIIINSLIVISVYFIKPKNFFLYWVSLTPYIQPILYIFFKPALTPFLEKFQPFLIHQLEPILLFMLLIVFRINKRFVKLNIILLPIFLLLLFISIQNFVVGLDVIPLIKNYLSVFWILAPFTLIISDRKVRPDRNTLIKFIVYFVYIQFFFCILNVLGFRIYDSAIKGGFEESLICGTFTRYNTMAEYLAIFFVFLSYEYWEYKRLNQKKYYVLGLLMGGMIFLSGSRMSLILYVLTVLFCIAIYKSKKIILLFLFAFSSLFTVFIIGNDHFSGQKADGGSGVERNLIGIIDLANSEDMTEGNTMSLSAYLLLEKMESPIIGNGRAYRKDSFYGTREDDVWDEGAYRVDATMAFMFVEYGIIGLLLFFFLFFSIFKGCYFYSEEHNKIFYWGVSLYFLLYSITDPGFWHYSIFSFFIIYVFSMNNKKQKGNPHLMTDRMAIEIKDSL